MISIKRVRSTILLFRIGTDEITHSPCFDQMHFMERVITRHTNTEKSFPSQPIKGLISLLTSVLI